MKEYALVFTVYLIIAIGAALLLYLLGAIGQRQLLKTLGYMHPSYAFIPVVNIYTVGWIAEQYDNKKSPQKEGVRLAYTFVLTAAVILISLVILFVAPSFLNGIQQGEVTELFFLPLFVISQICLAACLVLYYMALYKLFLIFDHDNAVIFLLVSLLFSLQYVIFFALKSKRPMYLRVSSPNYLLYTPEDERQDLQRVQSPVLLPYGESYTDSFRYE